VVLKIKRQMQWIDEYFTKILVSNFNGLQLEDCSLSDR